MPKKQAIRIQKIYEGVHRHPEYIKGSPKEIQALINQIKSDSTPFINEIKAQDTLGPGKFNFSLKEGNFDHIRNYFKIPIVAKITVVHWMYPKPEKTSILTWIFRYIILSIIVASLCGFFVIREVGEITKDIREDKCYIYAINGRPTAVEYAGKIVKLDENGKVPQLEEITWNPWYRDVLEKPCSVCEEKFIGESYCKRVEVWGAEGITTISQPLYQKP